MIEQVVKYEFLEKPAAGIGLINAGILKKHRDFWNKLSSKRVKKLYDIYQKSQEAVRTIT